MSHTTEWTGECWPTKRPKTPGPSKGKREATVTMHHNGDPTGGNVTFSLPNWVADAKQGLLGGLDNGMAEVHIPFDALKYLVLNQMRNEMVDALEQADGDDLIRLLGKPLYEGMLKLTGLQT